MSNEELIEEISKRFDGMSERDLESTPILADIYVLLERAKILFIRQDGVVQFTEV